MDAFLKGYSRNLQQSQPNHIECIVEKNTVFSDLESGGDGILSAGDVWTGFLIHRPSTNVAFRYQNSGKQQLILLIASDFDPEGEEIVQVAGRTLRDDFGVGLLFEYSRPAITQEQIAALGLHSMEAKSTSSRYKQFVEEARNSGVRAGGTHPEAITGRPTQSDRLRYRY